MKFAPIAVAAAALLSLHTLAEAATFPVGLGHGLHDGDHVAGEPPTLTPLAPAGSSVASYSVLSTAAWLL